MRNKIAVAAACIALASVLGACASNVGGKPMPALTFENMQPVPLEVANVVVENRYDPTRHEGDISPQFPTPPDVALDRYAKARLQPAGTMGTLKFIIEDASVRHKILSPRSNIEQYLPFNRREQYTIRAVVRLSVLDMDGIETRGTVVTVDRELNMSENVSLARREKEQMEALELLMKDFDAVVRQSLDSSINLLSRAPQPWR